MPYKTTFCMIKPDAVAAGYTGSILTQLEGKGFKIIAMRMITLSKSRAASFYEEHKERSFFQDLVDFMSSGPVVLLHLGHHNEAVLALREVIGATDPSLAAIGTLRFFFGTAANRNAIHGSDSEKASRREVAFFDL